MLLGAMLMLTLLSSSVWGDSSRHHLDHALLFESLPSDWAMEGDAACALMAANRQRFR